MLKTPEEIVDVAFAGHPRAALLRAAMLSVDMAAKFQETIAANPGARLQREAIVEYAEQKGGLLLEFLQLFDGPCWGTAMYLTIQQCATVLDVPPAELAALYDNMLEQIRER